MVLPAAGPNTGPGPRVCFAASHCFRPQVTKPKFVQLGGGSGSSSGSNLSGACTDSPFAVGWTTFCQLAIIGLSTGVCAAFVGGGAEILIIPMLVGFGVFSSYKQAIGTSLASLLLPIGAFAVYFYSKQSCGSNGQKCIDWPYAIIISAFFTLGTRPPTFRSNWTQTCSN